MGAIQSDVGTAAYGIVAAGEGSVLRMLCFGLIVAVIVGLKLLSPDGA